MKPAMLAALAVFLLAAPASAQGNCWWNGIGMQCRGGWGWDKERREERREEMRREERHERWRDHREHEEMRWREYCRYHPC